MEAPTEETEAPIDQENFPPLIKRFQSLIIDQAFLILCMVIFSQLLTNTNEERTGALRGILLFGLFFLYEPFLHGVRMHHWKLYLRNKTCARSGRLPLSFLRSEREPS